MNEQQHNIWTVYTAVAPLGLILNGISVQCYLSVTRPLTTFTSFITNTDAIVTALTDTMENLCCKQQRPFYYDCLIFFVFNSVLA